MEKIKIGTKFASMIGGKKLIECTVSDIVHVTYKSIAKGTINTRIIYMATSDDYGNGHAFETPKTTILRGRIK